MPQEDSEAYCGREPYGLASPGGFRAGVACGEGVPERENEWWPQDPTQEEIMGGQVGQVWHVQRRQ